ncbi:MAG TPA: beta-ketoacyl synthase N-terminal-like domain-containing protein, partial [bacterium]|nr:beta-ketoacyl synthase N-terminal-like domain-containing protein [bacterium]
MSQRRVVVTGLGTVNPLGPGVEPTWKAVLEGKSGVGPITLFDAKDCPVKIAAEVKGFDPTVPLPSPITGVAGRDPLTQAVHPKDVKRFGRFTHLGVAAGLQAYLDSGLDRVRGGLEDDRLGVNVGVGQGGLPEIQAVHDDYLAKGFR